MTIVSDFLGAESYLDYNENFELIKHLTSDLFSTESREVIIHALEIWDNICLNIKPIWLDLIEQVGFYPYFVNFIEKESNKNISLQTLIRTEFYKSDYLEGVYFHEKQKEIAFAISKGENIAVSAPTSYGKSLLIEEIVAKGIYSNILIIQPTLALIDETRRKLQKYNTNYNILVNIKQKIKEKNIFILTAERVLELQNLPQIDFFIIDEFYKISNRRNDSRIDALNVVLLRIMSKKPQCLFLTPTVDSLSEEFRKKYNIEFYKTDYNLVNTNIIEVRTPRSKKYYNNGDKKSNLFKLLEEQLEPSIVYVKSPNEAYKLANEYYQYLLSKKKAN